MKGYVVSFCYDLDEPPCYLRFHSDRGVYDLILNPRCADVFQSEEEARSFIRFRLPRFNEVNIVETSRAFEVFKDWKDSGFKVDCQFQVDPFLSREYSTEMSREDVVEYWVKYCQYDAGLDMVDSTFLDTWPKVSSLYQSLNGVIPSNEKREGVLGEHGITFSFRIYGIGPDVFKKELDSVEKYITRKTNNGRKYVLIDELDKYIALVFLEDGSYAVHGFNMFYPYIRDKEIYRGSLKDIFERVSFHLSLELQEVGNG